MLFRSTAGSPPRVAAVPGTRAEDHLTVADPRTAARAANAKVENVQAVTARAEARVKVVKGPLNLHLETVLQRARPDKNPNSDG